MTEWRDGANKISKSNQVSSLTTMTVFFVIAGDALRSFMIKIEEDPNDQLSISLEEI